MHHFPACAAYDASAIKVLALCFADDYRGNAVVTALPRSLDNREL